jgi:phytanoyl-CoA hydroxylase
MKETGMLSDDQVSKYRRDGHLTVTGVFSAAEIDAVSADLEAWAAAEMAALSEDDKAWYLEAGLSGGPALRKLDNPVALRPAFRDLARNEKLTGLVEQLIGADLSVCFSQVFFKAPGGGGPKPMHQDNFYFGPNDADGIITAWVALDDADVENGCLYYCEGSQHNGMVHHEAPSGQPFNLQVSPAEAARYHMTPAPVSRGGVSFHHGFTLHQSSDNRSDRWRRACAIHYVNGATKMVTPALTYDHSLTVPVGR